MKIIELEGGEFVIRKWSMVDLCFNYWDKDLSSRVNRPQWSNWLHQDCFFDNKDEAMAKAKEIRRKVVKKWKIK